MRRSVFLAVWLGLVLSLSKGNAAEPPDELSPPTSTTKASTTATAATTTVKTSSTTKENAPEPPAEPTASTTETPTLTPTESTTATAATTTVNTRSTTKENAPETSASTTATTTETPTASTTATAATTTAKTSSTTNENASETSASTTATTTETPTESSTAKETATDSPKLPTSGPRVDFCRGDPCGRNLAVCISLNSTYTCECPYGFYYSDKNCYRGKVFPATVAVNASYSDNLQIVNSTEYEEVFNSLSAFFKNAFEELTGYIETVIVEIKPQRESRKAASLNVTVTNLFRWDSTVDEASVNSAVQFEIKNGSQSYVDSYHEAKSCDIYRCDTKTTECQEGMFPECKCKPDLEKTEWDDRSCSACSKSCSAETHKYCVKEEEGPTCKCMTNFKNNDGTCVACPVGYSGEECTDNSELILIIVGTVLGAIILCLVIAVSIISVRAKHKRSPEKRSLIKPEYSDINTSDERPSMFPRVQTTSGHANPGYQPNNPYEMHSTNRDRFPERDYDDLYEISQEPRGFRMQNRY
ncbi:mucin-13 isoform X2 [Prinia subflava]|uniref:mucin-13 isoform X2 n=1 Tax=Prinia subflava TaxID=208062 RepID=UPI002FE17541